jgi:hypothetical protein
MCNWYGVDKILYRGFGSCNNAKSSNIGPRNNFRLDAKPVAYLFTDYWGPSYYPTNFVCRCSPKFYFACGGLAECATLIRQETYRKWQILVTWNDGHILTPDITELISGLSGWYYCFLLGEPALISALGLAIVSEAFLYFTWSLHINTNWHLIL